MSSAPSISPETEVLRFQHGLCVVCSMRIFNVDATTKIMEPITLPNIVLNGRCLLCYPMPKPHLEHHAVSLETIAHQQELPGTSISEISENNMNINFDDDEDFDEKDDDDYNTDIDGLLSCISSKKGPTKRRTRSSTRIKKKRSNINNTKNESSERRKKNDESTEIPQAIQSMPVSPSSIRSTKSNPTALHSPNICCTVTDSEGVKYHGRILSGTVEKGKVDVETVEVVQDESKTGKKQKKYVQAKYIGEVLKGKFHGKGILEYDTSTYEGNFENGIVSGYGVCKWKQTGFIYEGEWKKDQRHGVGKWYNKDKGYDSYDGAWEFDKFHGRGILNFAGGHLYEGHFVAASFEGDGTYIYSEQSRYDGQFKCNKRHGKGTMIYTGGETYDGEWKKELIHGVGVFEKLDGTKYDGTFETNQYFSGTIFLPDGRSEHVFERTEINFPDT